MAGGVVVSAHVLIIVQVTRVQVCPEDLNCIWHTAPGLGQPVLHPLAVVTSALPVFLFFWMEPWLHRYSTLEPFSCASEPHILPLTPCWGSIGDRECW